MFRTVLDGFLGQAYEHRGFVETDPGNFVRRDQHLFAGEPVAGFDDQLTDRPAFIVHHKIADVADDPVVGLEMVAAHGLRVSQMRIGAFGCGPMAVAGSLGRGCGGSSKMGKPLMPHTPPPCQ